MNVASRRGFASSCVTALIVSPLLASSPEDDATPVLYAISAGLFRKAGLDVDIVRINSGAAAASAVAGGSIQVAQAGMISLLSAHAREAPFTLIAPSGVYSSDVPDHRLLVKKDGPIRSARDLDGKTIGVLARAISIRGRSSRSSALR